VTTRSVLHYVQRWLPLSEQFVDAQIRHSRHRGVVVSRERFENADAFPYRPRWSLAMPRALMPHRYEGRAITGALTAVARRYATDVVHVHFGYRAHDVLGLVRRRGLPLVVSLHGNDVTAFARAWPRHYETVFDRSSAIVVPSRFLARHVESRGADAARVHVIPSGVDTQCFTPTPLPDGPPQAAFVGRFVEKKGLDVLAGAWPKVRAAVPGATLVLLGGGPCADLVAGLEGATVVPPTPLRRAEQVRDVMRNATVVVSPSRTTPDGDVESLLLANLEAQASGRPVVTTRHGGIPEFVSDGETALLVDEDDPAGLADALTRVLADRDFAVRLGAAGPARIAHLDTRRCAARVDELYESR
jgi:colanic acid/amylovoran biosynthesis glycosyltransferase